MKGPAIVLAAWSLWMAALATLGWFWMSDPLPPGLLSAASLGTATIAVMTLIAKPPETRILADSSLPVVAVAFGLAMALNGLAFGLWLVLIGAEIFVLGLFGLYREVRSDQRRRA